MFSIVITEKGGTQHQLELDGAEIGIGRLEDNDVCLPKTNVSKHHARLMLKDSRYVVVDQKSTNGTFVNGRRITGPTVLRRGDKIYIGDFILTLTSAVGGVRNVSAGAFSPLPSGLPPDVDPQDISSSNLTMPNERAVGLAPELKRTKPERRSPEARDSNFREASYHEASLREAHLREGAYRDANNNDATSRPPAPLQSPLPPPLPRTGPPPPPLPRSSPPSAPDVRNGTPLPGLENKRGPTMPPPAAPTTPTQRPSRRNADTTRANRTSMGASMLPLPTIPPLPVPNLRDGSQSEGVDSAQAAALSGLTSPAVLAPSVRLQGALSVLMERLATSMNVARAEESAFPSEHQATLERLLDQLAEEGTVGPEIDRMFLRDAAISEAVGLGPLDRLLANRGVREIVVDGPTRVLADLGGGLTPVSSFFSDDSAVLVVARRLLHRAGQKLVPDQMVHEAQLPGGGTLQLLLPPLSPKGALISVRCPMRAQNSPESFVTEGMLSQEMLNLLRTSLQQRKNVLVFGPNGAGVSQQLAMLTRLIPEHERIVSIEHTPSASLLNPQVLPLSRRALPNATLNELLRRASALRYDRLVLDDMGIDEAWSALFVAAGSGGVLMGMHAPTPQVLLGLLEYGAHSGSGGNPALPAPLLAAALQLLVNVGPDTAGTRRVLSISELRMTPSGGIEVRTLFRHDGKGFVASFLSR